MMYKKILKYKLLNMLFHYEQVLRLIYRLNVAQMAQKISQSNLNFG
jgi:hypothetical protein